jgi:hypothetical protein
MKKFIVTLSTILFLSLNIYLKAEELFFKTSVDLNGDKESENIILTKIGETGGYYLEISGKKTEGKIGDVPDGFLIIDINTNDKYKEIAVHTPGPSDDDEYLIYWYDGKSIKEMALLARWPEFLGNGIVYVDSWEGFWTKRDKYILNNSTRKLELVPQFAYYVGVKATVKKSFFIFKDKDLKQEVALLGKYSEIELLLCDVNYREAYDDLFLVKSKYNLIGWAGCKNVFENLEGLPSAD